MGKDEARYVSKLDRFPTTQFNNIALAETSIREAVAALVQHIAADGPPSSLRFVNSYSLALADHNADYQFLLQQKGVNFPDGKPLTFYLRRHSAKGKITIEQVRGPTFFEMCLDHGRAYGLRHYFLGGTESTLEKLKLQVEKRFPDAIIVGAESPPFRPLTDEEQKLQQQRVVLSDANIVWVGLGTPKQDFEVQRIVHATGITAAGVGAAFDFFAGTKPVAPKILRKLYLEWLFRFVTEPRRLWKRYLFGNAHFLRLAVREFLKTKAK